MVAQILGEEVPPVEVDPMWSWIWRAWHRLSAERSWVPGGMGPAQPCNIPWTTVMKWVDRHRIGPEDEALLDRCILAMDNVFKNWWAESAKKTEE